MNCKNCPYSNSGNGSSATKRTVIVHPYGNPLTLQFPIKKKSVNVTDGVLSENLNDMFGSTRPNEVTVEFSKGKRVFPFRAYATNGYITVTNVGSLEIGSYDITFVIKYDLNEYRYKQRLVLQIVDETENGGQYDNDEVNVLASHPVIQGETVAIIIGDDDVVFSESGHYKGDDTPNDENADVTAAYGDRTIEIGDNDIIINI